MYRTYSYNDMPKPLKRTPAEKQNRQDKNPAPKKAERQNIVKKTNNTNPINLEKDDIILIAVVLILLTDGCDDKILLAAVGFILVSEWL